MNEQKRKSLREAVAFLDRAITLVESVGDLEQDAIDNMPESFQMSERYERMQSAVDFLSDAAERLEEAKEYIQSALA